MNKWMATGATLAMLLMGGAGCTEYRLGTTLPAGLETVYVPVFVNESKEPQLETPSTQATVKEFQRDGTMRISTRDRADTLLEVTLTDFELEPLRYQRDDNLAGVQYRMKIQGRMVFSKLSPQPVVMIDKKVIGEATYLLVGDMTSSKQQAIPEATRDLAHHIVESIVEYW